MPTNMMDFKRQVLIVEDEEINRELLGAILENEYDLLYATNGKEALDVIKANPNTISLVLLDILMPVMNGLEFLKIRQESSELRKIPVIVLTSEKSLEVECLKTGATDFIRKPYDEPDIILARAHRIIELYEARGIITATNIDEFTGLYTKEYFMQYTQRLDNFYPEIDRDIIAINITHFNLINEIYGRTEGDTILRKISDHVKEFVGQTNGVGCRSYVDNFYIYCDHQESYDDFYQDLVNDLTDRNQSSKVRIRFGVYAYADKNLTKDAMIYRAVLACDSLKREFVKRIAYYDDSLHERTVFLERLINDFPMALKNHEFILHYQPKYNIRGERNSLSSAEALVRWKHPIYGMVSPGDFIPLFEANGLVQTLDNYVFEEVAHQMHLWKEKYDFFLPVSVNLSRIDIYNANLEKNILHYLDDNHVPNKKYMFEITESAYADNTTQLIDVVNSLRKDGFIIEMDDFGTGYSSLNMLADLPFDVLKIDMAFVRNIEKGPRNREIVKLIIDIARSLGAKIVAEGVETEYQYQFLKELGCDVVQGFYFSRALPVEEFEKLIERELAESGN